MKTLYVSDLDGTLLRSDETLSPFTVDTINTLVQRGCLFSYATARSYITASKVTNQLSAPLPLIVYNGAMIIHNADGRRLKLNPFPETVKALLEDLLSHGIYPIVYSLQGDRERYSFLPDKCTRGMEIFLKTREGDPRCTEVSSSQELFRGELFYITCIDEPARLLPMYRKYGQKYRAVYEKDFYSGEQWLEFMPKEASKANAVRQLKQMFQCDRVVAFGDGVNDLDMFRMADECYAMENAVPELKSIATGVISSNDEDGVARWLRENCI